MAGNYHLDELDGGRARDRRAASGYEAEAASGRFGSGLPANVRVSGNREPTAKFPGEMKAARRLGGGSSMPSPVSRSASPSSFSSAKLSVDPKYSAPPQALRAMGYGPGESAGQHQISLPGPAQIEGQWQHAYNETMPQQTASSGKRLPSLGSRSGGAGQAGSGEAAEAGAEAGAAEAGAGAAEAGAGIDALAAAALL